MRPVNRFRYLLVAPAVLAAGAMLGWAPVSGTFDEPGPIVAAAPVTTDHLAAHDAEPADEIEFGPAPPVFPAGAEMAVLQGDPGVAGEIFTVRLRFPAGYVLPAHWHPTDEHVTVISGTFLVGLGDTFDEGALLPALEPGDFITAPANANHFATARGKTVVQVHAIGPFELTYVNSADDPRNQAG
jgi:quercetin dioxygenase-like cupin family protein